VKDFVPNYIINAAAYTNVDGSEAQREECWQVNATAAGYLAEAARQVDARLIHVSTDYVFDGTSGPYTEEHRPNPLGFYGRAKLAGENAVMGSGANYAIGRTMVLYGHGLNVRPNFVTWLIKQLQTGNAVRIVTDQFGNPTLASELAVALRTLAESGKNGIFHLSGAEIIDRHSFALKIATVFHLNKKLIIPIRTADLEQQALRPTNSGFDLSKAVKELGVSMSDVVGGLQKFKKEKE
jgi:dTDP-4-dehydrorhamnose reductase